MLTETHVLKIWFVSGIAGKGRRMETENQTANAETAKHASFRRSALRGSVWVLLGFGASQLLRFSTNILLARTLSPSHFGLMALIASLLQGLQMFSDLGIGPSIIRSPQGETSGFLNTAWTLQILRGIGLWLFCCAIAPPLSKLYSKPLEGMPSLGILIPIVGLTAVSNGFTSTSIFTLNRSLKMGRLVALDLAAQSLSSLCTLIWSLWHPDVWALVAGGFVYSGMRVLLSHLLNVQGRNMLQWDSLAAGELLSFGRWVFVSTLVSFAAAQIDRPILASLVSISDFGLYNIALSFACIAIEITNRLSSFILFPLLTKHGNDSEQMIALCVNARFSLLWISGALCASFAILSPMLFGFLYDARYSRITDLTQWLTICVWTWILRATIDRLPLAMGQPRELLLTNLVNCTGIVFSLIGFHLWRIPGFVLGFSLGNVFAHLFLTLRLPYSRAPMLKQSLVFTTAWLCYCVPVIFALRAVSNRTGFNPVSLHAFSLDYAALPTSFRYVCVALAGAALPCALATWVLKNRFRVQTA